MFLYSLLQLYVFHQVGAWTEGSVSHQATVYADMVGVDLSVEMLCVHLGVCMGTALHPTTVPVTNITKVLGVIKPSVFLLTGAWMVATVPVQGYVTVVQGGLEESVKNPFAVHDVWTMVAAIYSDVVIAQLVGGEHLVSKVTFSNTI